jgi:hypothetical protein
VALKQRTLNFGAPSPFEKGLELPWRDDFLALIVCELAIPLLALVRLLAGCYEHHILSTEILRWCTLSALLVLWSEELVSSIP